MIEKRHIRALEFDKVLERLADNAVCDGTKELVMAIEIKTDIEEVKDLQEQTKDANMLMERYGSPNISNVKDVTNEAKRAELGSMLTLKELLDIGRLLGSVRELSNYYKKCENVEIAFEYLFNALVTNRSLEDSINTSILSEEQIADNASAKLNGIRRKIRQSGIKIRENLDRMVKSQTTQKYLQEAVVTMREGRYVLPVKAEYRNEIKGLVHDTSSSGATIFIEPLSVVEANNEIKVLKSEEEEEINRIIYTLSAECGDMSEQTINNYKTILSIDLIFAKAKYGYRIKGVTPSINEEGRVELKQARHPLIEIDKVVPTNIRLGSDYDTLMITGPNTGGKTVALKTLGLLTLMAMSGLMIPAQESSEVSVFDRVYADIGDEQSIEQSLSTFSSHMKNIVEIVENVDRKSLVLLDELGAGTDPIEGAALAKAVLEHMREKGGKIAATTHYSELKLYALETVGVENGCLEFDTDSLKPTYRLMIGVPGRSNAFLISKTLGLKQEIIERADKEIDKDAKRFEEVVKELEKTRQELEAERDRVSSELRKIEKEKEEVKAIKERMKEEKEREILRASVVAKKMVEDVRLESESLIKELEEIRKKKEEDEFTKLTIDARLKMRSRVGKLSNIADPVLDKEEDEYVLPRELVVGDAVTIRSMGAKGTVTGLKDKRGQLSVTVGLMKLKVGEDDIILMEAKAARNIKRAANSEVRRGITSKMERKGSIEIDIRGHSVEEGIMEVDRFIDNAVMSGLCTVTVIHGKGTGVLREGVRRHLKMHKQVRSFRLGVYGEGEDGVTVVEIKG